MEEWKDIPNYENSYKVSDLGNARSLNRFSINSILIKGKSIKLNKDRFGYYRFTVTKGVISKTLRIHRIVGELFIPNPLNLPQLNHLDGNKENNAKTNLEWSSDSNNKKHAYSIGLMVGGNQYTNKQK